MRKEQGNYHQNVYFLDKKDESKTQDIITSMLVTIIESNTKDKDSLESIYINLLVQCIGGLVTGLPEDISIELPSYANGALNSELGDTLPYDFIRGLYGAGIIAFTFVAPSYAIEQKEAIITMITVLRQLYSENISKIESKAFIAAYTSLAKMYKVGILYGLS